VSLAFLDLIDLEPTLQATFGWCAVVGLLGLLLARWKWWSALVTVPFALFCSMHWEFEALGREVFVRGAAGPEALFTYLAEGMVVVLIGVGIAWNRGVFNGRMPGTESAVEGEAEGPLNRISTA